MFKYFFLVLQRRSTILNFIFMSVVPFRVILSLNILIVLAVLMTSMVFVRVLKSLALVKLVGLRLGIMLGFGAGSLKNENLLLLTGFASVVLRAAFGNLVR